jgi:hypothetical protein
MKHEKPGPKPKKSKISNRSPRIHDMPKPTVDDVCSFCDLPSGTLAWRHAEDDTIKWLDGGKGVGQKINDNLSALACARCDVIYSTKPHRNAPEIEKLRHSIAWGCAVIKSRLLRG